MILYALACDKAHEFESWFPSSEGFAEQQARGLVTCPICNSGAVEKRIMAPSVARTDRSAKSAAPSPPETPAATPEPAAPQPVALLSERELGMRAMLKAMREHVMRNAEPVGDRFVDEARKMHYGEIEHRSIYGQASPAEAHALIEEGVEVHPLPIAPDDRN